jgi:FkbM family methyltransferase
LNQNSIIYSFGIGDDISFDLDLIRLYHATVHAFDPTPRSLEWIKSQELPKDFVLHQFGVADYDGFASFYPPANSEFVSFSTMKRGRSEDPTAAKVYRLSTIMKMLGHERIDVLKMDVEGSEYNVIEDLVFSNLNVCQVLVEFHHRFKGIGKVRTIGAVEKLGKSGYRLFYQSRSAPVCSFIASPEPVE